MAEELPELPLRLIKVIGQLERQGADGDWRGKEMRRLRQELARQHARSVSAVAGGALCCAGPSLLLFGPGPLLSGTAASTLALASLTVGSSHIDSPPTDY